jgi:RNA polymerase sigma-70 factor (ECF subfamily)
VVSTYGRSASEREDLQQELALALWRAWPNFRGECSERTFVFRVAHNVGLSHAWKRPPPSDAESESPDPALDPEATVSVAQRRAMLLRAIQGLPASMREVVTLALEDLSHQEIADVVGITPNNVAVRLNRARELLREAMGVRHDDER